MPRRIQAQPTRYKGIQFQSKLEARMAVFWDVLQFDWYYEPATFQLSTGKYTPDFYLVDPELWVEVKPFYSKAAVAHLEELVERYNFETFLQCGLVVPNRARDRIQDGSVRVNQRQGVWRGCWWAMLDIDTQAPYFPCPLSMEIPHEDDFSQMTPVAG